MNENAHKALEKRLNGRSPVVPVIDVRGGVALHARAGKRENYLPVEGVLGHGRDPLKLAQSIVVILGIRELYIADLDAIAGGTPDLHLIQALNRDGIMTWVDAGIKSASACRQLRDAGVTSIIVASETLPGPSVLREIVKSCPIEQLIFSLDLREGRPILPPGSEWMPDSPVDLISAIHAIGIHRYLLLETSGMGTGRGFGNSELIQKLKHKFPTAEIAVGGGVAGIDDVTALLRCGVSRVLVGSALHNGRIGRHAIDRLGPITTRT